MEKELMALVKAKARRLSLTQIQVAEELHVSLPTVKRWWSGKGVTLPVLSKLCAHMGIPLSELILEAENQAYSRYTYTPEQETMFVQFPQALALFDLIVSGKSLPAIKRMYQLSEATLTSLLLKLDRIKLIDLGTNNKIKLLQTGEPQWIVGGPLSQKYRQNMIATLLGDHAKSETTFLIHDYLPEDVALIHSRIKELEKLMSVCNARSAGSASAVSYGTYITFKRFEWDLRGSLQGLK